MLDFKTQLNAVKNNKIESYALCFAEDIQPRLIESAAKGYSGFTIDLQDREDSHLLKNPLFLEFLNELLDGCAVKIKTTEHVNILFKNKYLKHHLSISW